MVNPYQKFVAEHARLLNETGGQRGQLTVSTARRANIAKDAPRTLIFSPHPDDECIVGALPLRLLRELKNRVLNVAVTLGSRKDRQRERLNELRQACDSLGFEVLLPDGGGLEKINPGTRTEKPAVWKASVKSIAGILREQQPRIIFCPHAADWNTTHTGVNLLVNDALTALPKEFCCWVCETEYWAPMNQPNLMVESSVAEVADLVAALAMHTGEVQRNPYHLRLPAWMIDNVRRGGELVGGQGGEPPSFTFATLYRLRKWVHGHYEENKEGKMICANDSLANLFG